MTGSEQSPSKGEFVSSVETGRPEFLDAKGARLKIHPDDVSGRFMTWRRIVYSVLMLIYLATPFITIGGRPAIHLDLPARRFYLLGQAFNAQDAWLLVFLLGAFAFGLVFVTALAGRVWCGWACPQTVFLEFLYRPIERLIEGTGNQRRALDKEGLGSPRRLALFAIKHLAFLTVSLALAHWFLAFFVPVPELAKLIISGPSSNPTVFAWAMGITFLLQFNFAWFREQICFIVCPYGRFQSVLVDNHSLVIAYDLERGEPRGKKLRVLDQPPGDSAVLKGDCVDCGRCVRVCPTGIDIRNGVQMECIGCAQCIDACDEVMVKLGRDKGLVRYDSLLGFAGAKTKLARGRTFVYGALALAAITFAVVNVVHLRSPFEANLLRAQGIPYVLERTSIRNTFELHLINKHPEPADFEIRVTVPSYATAMVPQPTVRLGTLESLRTPILITAMREGYRGPFDIQVDLVDVATGQIRSSTGRFVGPPGMGGGIKPGS